MVVPDLRAIVEEYLNARGVDASEPSLADRVNVRLMLRDASAPTGALPYRMYKVVKDFHSHKWMYDAQSLASRLREAGFADVQQRDFLDSRIAGIEEVEAAGRVLDGAGVCVEGIKPLMATAG